MSSAPANLGDIKSRDAIHREPKTTMSLAPAEGENMRKISGTPDIENQIQEPNTIMSLDPADGENMNAASKNVTKAKTSNPVYEEKEESSNVADLETKNAAVSRDKNICAGSSNSNIHGGEVADPETKNGSETFKNAAVSKGNNICASSSNPGVVEEGESSNSNTNEEHSTNVSPEINGNGGGNQTITNVTHCRGCQCNEGGYQAIENVTHCSGCQCNKSKWCSTLSSIGLGVRSAMVFEGLKWLLEMVKKHSTPKSG